MANAKEKKMDIFFAEWIKYSIFDFKKGDGAAYIVFYVMIPVIVTIISLKALPGDDISIIYCYMTILISAFNSIYDSANRWNSEKKSLKNVKIFAIIFSNVCVVAYCIYVILYILIAKDTTCRLDWVLLVYLIAIAVAVFDAFSCFARDMALQACIKKEV